MPSNTAVNFILGGAALIVLLAAAYIWIPREKNAPQVLLDTAESASLGEAGENAPPNTETPATGAPVFSTIKIALLDTEGTSGGQSRGCDSLVLVDRTVAPTTAPLGAALRELFSIEDERVSGYYNFMARTNDTLAFERVTLENGVAHVYLTGSVSGLAGVCDDPRASIQIEETALQFPSVRSVKLYLNGSETTLIPSQRGE